MEKSAVIFKQYSMCNYINSTFDCTSNYKFNSQFTIRIIKIRKKIIVKVNYLH